jgi:hypothetical protein
MAFDDFKSEFLTVPSPCDEVNAFPIGDQGDFVPTFKWQKPQTVITCSGQLCRDAVSSRME